MRSVAADGVMCLSVGLSVTVVSPAKTDRSRCRLGCGLGCALVTTYSMGPDPTMWRGNFEFEKGPAQDMPGHVWRSIYSKRLSRGQHRYGADADCSVLDGSVHWRRLANTTEPIMCGGGAAFCQITLTTCHYYRQHAHRAYAEIYTVSHNTTFLPVTSPTSVRFSQLFLNKPTQQ